MFFFIFLETTSVLFLNIVYFIVTIKCEGIGEERRNQNEYFISCVFVEFRKLDNDTRKICTSLLLLFNKISTTSKYWRNRDEQFKSRQNDRITMVCIPTIGGVINSTYVI